MFEKTSFTQAPCCHGATMLLGAIVLYGFVLWFGSYAYLYFYPITGFKPLYSYALLLGYVVFRVLIAPGVSVPRDRGAQEMLLWLAAFVFYTCVMFFISSQSETARQMVITWTESALLLAGFMLLFSERRALKDIQIIFALIAIIGVTVNFYDFFNPIFTGSPGRAAGLYGNPNIAGKFIALSMVAALPVLPRGMRLGFVVFCGLGVLVTFSRSAWILWWIGVLFLGWTGVLVAERYRMTFVLTIGAVSIGMMVLLFTGALGQLVSDTPLIEYLNADARARLGVGSAAFSDELVGGRQMVALGALEHGAQSPLLGNGLAYTKETEGWPFRMAPHNMYLLLWVEGGIIGIGLYIWFLVILWRHGDGTGRTIAVLFMIVSLFTHNQLDQPAAVMIAAFAIAQGRLSRRARTAQEKQPISTVYTS